MISAYSYVVDVIEGRRRGALIKGALLAMSRLFQMGVKMRNFAFDHHWIRVKKVPIPTISIGNITAGGTGKTPFTQLLAKDLESLGRVAILSRGYRSQVEKKNSLLFINECSKVDPKVCGDEPFLLFKALPQAYFFIGKNRLKSAQWAVNQGAEIILLDDGMQYRLLHRDLEIVMVHGHDLYGRGFYLPRGYLRDPPIRLKKADVVVVHAVQSKSHFKKLQEKLQKKTRAPIIGSQMTVEFIEMEDRTKVFDLKGIPIGAFCGLGHPSSFFKTLTKMGAHLVCKWSLLDHCCPTKKEWSLFYEACREKGCQLLICSEKDRVKLPSSLYSSVPIGTLKVNFNILFGKSHYEELLQNIQTLVAKRRVLDD